MNDYLLQETQQAALVTVLGEQHHVAHILRVVSDDAHDVRMMVHRLHHLNLSKEGLHLLHGGHFAQCLHGDRSAFRLEMGAPHQPEGTLSDNAVEEDRLFFDLHLVVERGGVHVPLQFVDLREKFLAVDETRRLEVDGVDRFKVLCERNFDLGKPKIKIMALPQGMCDFCRVAPSGSRSRRRL